MKKLSTLLSILLLLGTQAQAGSRPVIADTISPSAGNTTTTFPQNLTVTGTLTGGTISGNAATATALAGTPTVCSGNNFSLGIASNGNASCSQPAFSQLSGNATNSQLATMANNTVKGNVSGSSATPSDLPLASSATASSVMYRDSNTNTVINDILQGFSFITAAAGTTVLTISSPPIIYVTGSTTQIIQLPTGSTLTAGWEFRILNGSTGAVTVKDSAGTTIVTLAGQGTVANGTFAKITLVNNATNGTWYADYHASGVPPVSFGGTGLTAGTSGGIPYFSASNAMASSAALTQYGVVIGGGAGAAPVSLAQAASGTLLTGQGAANPSFSASPSLGTNGTTNGTLGLANGGASGATVTLQNLGATTAYNWNYPTTAGGSGSILTSGGGGASLMTWTSVTGSGSLVEATSPTLVSPALGTPTALVGTNITGTASGLTAGNVTTNANLTGPITSVGNATSVNSQTGTGSTFVMNTSPTLITPALGTPSSATLTNATGLPLSSGVTGTLPILNGGTGVAAATTTPTASTYAGWDANKNLSANNHIEGYTTTATAAGTTTLTVGSTYQQNFTGSTTQTVTLPVASTLVNGFQFQITNQSSGIVTVQTSGANTVQAMAANTALSLICVNTAGGTGTASWTWQYGAIQNSLAGGGSVTSVGISVAAGGMAVSGSPVTTSGSITLTPKSPTIQKFLSGSGTYTTPTSPGPLYIRVRAVGGGGGGGAGTTKTLAGTAGGVSTFGTSLISAGGGSGGDQNAQGASGGTSSLGTGPIGIALTGGSGGGSNTSFSTGNVSGGSGGNSALGGGGGGGYAGTVGQAGAANTGGGGGGAGSSSASPAANGSGGGAGGFVDAIITSPAATYSYVVGAGGNGGTGTTSGGAGGSGLVEVTEYYQ